MFKSLLDTYHQLPLGLQQAPIILGLIILLLLFMTGHLYTGRTFDREIGRCEKEVEFYKGRVFK